VPFELLPPHRTVYAMSVHKSQGSEFATVIMCLPPQRSPILTRELVYTGLTRAKKRAMVVGSAEVLRASLLVKVERGGQLSTRLEREL
jgi:exodeoxyribonuclease V alpha subunit